MIPWTQQQGAAVPRPKTGETPIRHVRVDEKLWGQVVGIAREQGRSVTAVVLDALKRYVAWHKRQHRGDS
jgi:hypothetical protein